MYLTLVYLFINIIYSIVLEAVGTDTTTSEKRKSSDTNSSKENKTSILNDMT